MIISDAHHSLKSALASELPGAAWQKIRAHFMRNLMTKVAKNAHNLVAHLDALDLRPVRRYMSANALEQAQADHQELRKGMSRGQATRSLFFSRVAYFS
jgi:transposase-like protein